MLVYRVLNTENGKQYIGQTKSTFSHRRSQHINKTKRGCRVPFHAAIRKYGNDAFTWEIIAQFDDPQVANLAEQLFIKELQTKVPSGYNRTDGGAGVPGGGWKLPERRRKPKQLPLQFGSRRSYYAHSLEARAKMSASRIGKKMSVLTRQRMSDAAKGACPARAVAIKAWWAKRKEQSNSYTN